MNGRELDAALLGLAVGGAGRGVLDAVVDGVADQVHQRIGQALDHGLVELGILARGDELDRLRQVARQIVDQAAETAEQRADRHHSCAHRGIAK